MRILRTSRTHRFLQAMLITSLGLAAVGCAPLEIYRPFSSAEYGPAVEWRVKHTTPTGWSHYENEIDYIHSGRLLCGEIEVRRFTLAEPLAVRAGDGIVIPLTQNKEPILWVRGDSVVSSDPCELVFALDMSDDPDGRVVTLTTVPFHMSQDSVEVP